MLQVQQIGRGEPLVPPVPFEDGFKTSDHMHTPQIADAIGHARINNARDVPDFRMAPEHGRTLMICAGGPSIKDTLPQIRDRLAAGNVSIIAINDTYDWLVDQGITPDYFAMAEIAEWPKEFLTKAQPQTTYFLADIAHPSGFDRLSGFNVVRWHLGSMDDDPFQKPYRDVIKQLIPQWCEVGGGEAVSTKAIALGHALGYRDFEMYGVDGCYREGERSHAYLHRFTSWPELVTCEGRVFLAPYYLARQADDIRRMCEIWKGAFTLRCYGDGLVQHMHRTGWPEQYG